MEYKQTYLYKISKAFNKTEAKGVNVMRKFRRHFVNEEFSPNSLEDCKQRIKRLLKFASANTYSAMGYENALVLDSGEFLEAVYLYEDGNSKYLQYEPSSGKVITNYRDLSYREVAEILENIENDNI